MKVMRWLDVIKEMLAGEAEAPRAPSAAGRWEWTLDTSGIAPSNIECWTADNIEGRWTFIRTARGDDS